MRARKIRAGSLVFALACIAGMGIALADDTGINITTEKTEYRSESGSVKYTIRNGRDEAVYILACPAAFLEFKKDGAWSGALEPQCGAAPFLAEKIEPGASLEASLLLPSVDGVDSVSCRVAQRFYFECAGDAPGSASVTCSRQTEVARSNDFTVK